ncbi:MAG TPA: flavin reductase family protein [Lachnospiraceae bacterium]|nr:flavin reductase family protein [Lachnospiraceae bacterium]
MAKKEWKPGNMLYPLPAVLVTSRNKKGDEDVCTIAWTGTVSSDPPMVSISVRPSRLTYEYIKETGVFVINITTESLAFATDYCGIKSGRDENKFETAHLKTEPAAHISCPMLSASPVNLECSVTKTRDLGSHTIFLAKVLAVHVDDRYMDGRDKFNFSLAKPLVYVHGEYRAVGKYIGKFGYSVEKKNGKEPQGRKNKA